MVVVLTNVDLFWPNMCVDLHCLAPDVALLQCFVLKEYLVVQ